MSRPGNAWRKIHGSMTGKPTNFSWVIPGRLAGSGMPMSRPEFDWLVSRGIGAVVTMTENALPTEWIHDIKYLHVPTPDMTAPQPEGIEQAVDFIHSNITQDTPAMVHCAAGLGRAGTILACYHVKHMGHSASDAIQRIRDLRPGSIQSPAQELAISMYERQVRG